MSLTFFAHINTYNICKHSRSRFVVSDEALTQCLAFLRFKLDDSISNMCDSQEIPLNRFDSFRDELSDSDGFDKQVHEVLSKREKHY